VATRLASPPHAHQSAACDTRLGYRARRNDELRGPSERSRFRARTSGSGKFNTDPSGELPILSQKHGIQIQIS
jgi:hypothetical protein